MIFIRASVLYRSTSWWFVMQSPKYIQLIVLKTMLSWQQFLVSTCSFSLSYRIILLLFLLVATASFLSFSEPRVWRQPLYLLNIGVRCGYTLPSSDPIYEITLGLLLFLFPAISERCCMYLFCRDLCASTVNTGFGIWTLWHLQLCITSYSFHRFLQYHKEKERERHALFLHMEMKRQKSIFLYFCLVVVVLPVLLFLQASSESLSSFQFFLLLAHGRVLKAFFFNRNFFVRRTFCCHQDFLSRLVVLFCVSLVFLYLFLEILQLGS